MQIGPSVLTPHQYTAADQPDESSPSQRRRREINEKAPDEQQLVLAIKPNALSQGGGYKQTSVDPDPGKSVANSQKTPTATDLGLNINVDPATKEISKAFKSIEQEASDFLKEKFAEMKAQEPDPAKKQKWDIDPDNTYLVTYDYNREEKEPYPAKITQRISLTQALITNAQHTPEGKGYSVPFFEGGPNVKAQDSVTTHTPKFYDLNSRVHPHSQEADITHSYQGIYTVSPEASSSAYNASNQSSIPPAEFKKLIWKADFQKPYTEFLDQFWNSHKEKYPVLAKAAFVKSAMAQHQEGSLTAEGRALVMRAAGLPGNQDSWPDINYEALEKNPAKDPNLEVGLLKIGAYTSTDLMYITDKKVTFDANGNKIAPLTLLYIPGNSSPLHSFNSPAEMRTWLAAQMADPLKRNALASHFPLKDKPDGWERAGIDETLAGLGAWPEKRETPGGLLSYNHRAFSGKWDPQEFITTEPTNLPFEEITKRQKDRSYADADIKITSDADITKNKILSGFEKATKAALFLTPLALMMPEVALALDAFYFANAAATVGIGIDDEVQGKPKGTERIVFGTFNAALVVAPHIAEAVKGGEGGVHKITSNTLMSPEPEESLSSNLAADAASPPPPLPDYSAHALPDNFLDGRTIRGDGTYQVADEFYIRFTDGTGESKVFQVERFYKGGGNPIRVVDPVTRNQVMILVPTNNGEWRLANNLGGGRKQLNSINQTRPKPQERTIAKDSVALRDSTNQQLANHQDWQSITDSGMHNGQPVYIHYTDKAGAEAIAREHAITDSARGETRAGSKGGVYVNPPGQQFNAANVENLLFLGNERYVGRGDYMVIFSTDQVPQDLGAVTAGSPFVELKMPKEIKLTPSNFVYSGPNRFPDYFG